MSTLFISEFADLPITSNGVLQAPAAQSWVTDQTISISGSSAASAAFNVETAYVVLSADVSCSISWTQPGATTNPATTSNVLLPANVPMKFGVAGGGKVSVIANS